MTSNEVSIEEEIMVLELDTFSAQKWAREGKIEERVHKYLLSGRGCVSWRRLTLGGTAVVDKQCQAQGLRYHSGQAVLPCAWHLTADYQQFLRTPLSYAPLFNKASLAILLPPFFVAQPGQSTMPISKKQGTTTVELIRKLLLKEFYAKELTIVKTDNDYSSAA